MESEVRRTKFHKIRRHNQLNVPILKYSNSKPYPCNIQTILFTCDGKHISVSDCGHCDNCPPQRRRNRIKLRLVFVHFSIKSRRRAKYWKYHVKHYQKTKHLTYLQEAEIDLQAVVIDLQAAEIELQAAITVPYFATRFKQGSTECLKIFVVSRKS